MEKADRAEVLGFKPQKEVPYNRILPYAVQLDAESNELLSEIKGNLARAVELRDIKVGAIHWVGQLARYIHLYGLKFSKDDHIYFIKLLYELVLIPHYQFSLTHKFAQTINNLLKKHHLLSPDELTLPWKPLYDFCQDVFDSHHEMFGLHFFSSNIDSIMKDMISNCRPYFDLETTSEMLKIWKPLLCPFDSMIEKALNCMDYFLPTLIPPEHHSKGFKLWLHEVMMLWSTSNNTPGWECSLVSLIARLAYDNIGYIDWTPYIPQIFTRFLKGFNLPVGNSHNATQSNNNVDIISYVQWIVSSIGNNSCAQDHIDKLFKTLKTFYHPSNTGRWNLRLTNLLVSFPKIFIKRLHRERVALKSWKTPIPDSHKLTDEDVTRFVKSMQPVVFMAMFSKFGSHDASVALKHLASMRPEIIVPPLLEKMYPAMETLTEPHRLIACMTCIVGVCRPMLRAKKWYPEGPLHILPLLNLSLPGIDSNDFKKSVMTFQMISTFVSLVPLVDCSNAIHLRDDLTEVEKEICSASAQFEDFVLQFMHRGFSLIENNAQEEQHGHTSSAQDNLNPEQTLLEVGLSSTFKSILEQCSTPIFESALSCLFNFVSNTYYETHVGGRFVANLCKSAVKVNTEKSLRLFIPHFTGNIRRLIAANEDLKNEEKLDVEFLWNILMLSQVVRSPGQYLLVYKEELLEVLLATLELKCVEGYEHSTNILRYLLRSLTNIYPLDYRNVSSDIDQPITEYLAIRDWAYTCNVDQIDIKWHIPSAEEIQFATTILEKVLQPQLDAISKISEGNEIPREDLLRRLCIILECLLGAGAMLNVLSDEPHQIVDSEVDLKYFGCVASISEGILLNGKCVRQAIVDAIRPLLNYLLTHSEDDTKSLHKIILIYDCLIFFHGTLKKDFDTRWKNFHLVKNVLEDKLAGHKTNVRALLVDRVLLQHELRMLLSAKKKFTKVHKLLLHDLLALSTSRYSGVRKKGQTMLFHVFLNFQYSYMLLLPEIVKNLTDPTVPEHKFKSSLYIMKGNGSKALIVKRQWNVLGQLWPALVKAQHSEELSILKVIDDINSAVTKYFETPAIKIVTPVSCIEKAQDLLKSSSYPKPKYVLANAEEMELKLEQETARNEKFTEMYKELVNDLVTLVEKGDLSWKFRQLGIDLLTLLLRHDHMMPICAVNMFLKNAIDDSIYVRLICISSLMAVFEQLKRKHKVVDADLEALTGCLPLSSSDSKCLPGKRKDNTWHQFRSESLPRTKEAWEKCTFVEKTHWGFYCWPQPLSVYAPYSEQPQVARDRSELNESEKLVYDRYSTKEYVDKFISLVALEEQKGRDKFRHRQVYFFKGLFRNFGDTFLEVFKPQVEKLLAETNPIIQETHHRCALEILAGMIRGSKHWPFEKVDNLWSWASKVLRKHLNNISVETLDDWGQLFTLICESRDPRKLFWVFDILMDNPLNGDGGSFGDSSRLYVLQMALITQEWRVTELLENILSYLEPHLDHPYKNVRDRIGSLLCYIFLYDYEMHPDSQSFLPLRKMFVCKVLAELEPLKNLSSEDSSKDVDISSTPNGYVAEAGKQLISGSSQDSDEESEEKKRLIRLCKTVVKWLVLSVSKMLNPASEEIYGFLPILCSLVSQSQEEELRKECLHALANLAQANIPISVIPVAMQRVQEVTTLPSWNAKSAVLSFLQAMVFNNFFVLHKPLYVRQIRSLLMLLICNERLEVRQSAADTLSGLLHCGFLEMDSELLSIFERLSSTKLGVKDSSFGKPMEEAVLQRLIHRHAGVLGLCACIEAYPYEVPQFMPQLLVDISTHVNDLQPIQMTVKKTLSNFRRTHHDNWHDHKQKFTDDQLLILTDLLVSPNYYA